jgi:CRP-like cAMP-binding protein
MLTVLEKVNLLQKAQIFQGVRTESLARVAAIAEEANYEARHLLFSENDAAESMFVLIEGEIALLRNGQETEKVGADRVVGALSVLAGGAYAETAVATQHVRALRIDQQDFYDAMADDFNITRGILRALVRSAAGGF